MQLDLKLHSLLTPWAAPDNNSPSKVLHHTGYAIRVQLGL